MSQIVQLEAEVLAAMNDDQLVAEIFSIISDIVPYEIIELNLESSLKQDLNIDSLGAFELIMNVEDRFGIKIVEDEIENIFTIKDIVIMIRKVYA